MAARRILLLGALALLQANAKEVERCTYGAAGDLVGHEIFVNSSTLLPSDRRQYTYDVPVLPGCALNGVSARVCDLFPPDVRVAAGLARVRVRRLGPRLRPLRLDLTLYCDSLNTP